MKNKTKCILKLISIFTFLLLVIIKIVVDESEIESLNIIGEDNIEHANYENKLKYQIDYLSQLKDTSQSLLDRKENAVWAAFALYITGLVLLFKYLKEFQKLKCGKQILISFILLIIAISVFAFIHAQYSSIYDTKATAHASKILLLGVIDGGNPIDNLRIAHHHLYHAKLKEEQKYRGKLHPLRIVISFICLDWTKSAKRELTSVNTQEASIYFLLILFNFICIGYLLIGVIKDIKKT
jgi:hypothetical protein